MTKKELEMIIKEKEMELKNLKKQLKEMQEKEKQEKEKQEKEVELLSYSEVIQLDDYKSYLESLDKKSIIKIAKQGGVRYNVNVESLIEIIESRNRKGDAWR